MPPRIVVFGATGYTGRLVAETLSGGSTPLLLSGRDDGRLARLATGLGGATTQTADAADPQTLQRLVRRGDALINCAGPFTELGEPVVRACIAAGAHYLDTTGEQEFMKRIRDRYHDAAREAGVIVVNAMAFEYALGDCAAAVAAQQLASPPRRVDVTYLWKGGAGAASRGTRRSVLRVLGSKGYAYRDGQCITEAPAAHRRSVPLPDGTARPAVSFPAGEILTVPQHLAVHEVRGWMVTGRTSAALLPRLSAALPLLTRLAAPFAEWLLRRGPEGPSREQRARSSFTILADAASAGGEVHSVVLRGHDPYGLTAAIAVRGTERALKRAGKIAGVLAPAQLVEPRAFLDALAVHGMEWDSLPAAPP